MAIGDAPVLEALADITAVSVARSELDPQSLLLVRLAALIAVDAPESSYLLHVGPAAQVGVTVELVQDVLVAVQRRHAGRSGVSSDRVDPGVHLAEQ